MWRSVLTWSIAGICFAVGMFIAAYKYTELSFPLVPDSSIHSWYIELHSSLQSPPKWQRRKRAEEAFIHVIEPRDNGSYAVVDSQNVARGFGKQVTKDGDTPIITFTKRKPDDTESLTVRFLLYELDVNDVKAAKKAGTDLRYTSNDYVKDQRISNPTEDLSGLYESIDLVINEALEKSATPQSFLTELWKVLDKDNIMSRYLMQATQTNNKSELMVLLSQVAGYPARVANGLLLGEKHVRSQQLIQWVELLDNEQWRRFNPEDGEYFTNDVALYRWWVGSTPLLYAPYFTKHVTNIAVKPNIDSSLTRALWQAKDKQPLAYYFALQTLPLEQQLVLQILLLMPVGALIVSFLRQVIGVKTFGTFMPVLVALAFRETGLTFGVIFFVSLVTIGLILRHYLSALRLLMVPRLSTILTIVVTILMFVMVGFKDSNMPLGVSVALFPVVIITMVIERMSNVWEERGARTALVACSGSVAVACLVYLVIINPAIRHIMFTFPEMLLVVLAGCLLLGRYNGYKLTEYMRFRQLRNALRTTTS